MYRNYDTMDKKKEIIEIARNHLLQTNWRKKNWHFYFRPAFVPPESKLLKFELLSNQSDPVTSVNLGESVYFKAEYYYNNEYRKFKK